MEALLSSTITSVELCGGAEQEEIYNEACSQVQSLNIMKEDIMKEDEALSCL